MLIMALTMVAKAPDHPARQVICALFKLDGGGAYTENQVPQDPSIVPHSRTLRKAREQVKLMVIDGVSPRRISSYLHRWATWWVRTSESWLYQDLMRWFLNVCWDTSTAAIARALYQQVNVYSFQTEGSPLESVFETDLRASARD